MVTCLYGFTGFHTVLMNKITYVVLLQYSISINKLPMESMTDLSAAANHYNLQYIRESERFIQRTPIKTESTWKTQYFHTFMY